MEAQERAQPKPGKSPVVNIKSPQTFVLENGLKVMIVENHKLPKVTFNLTIDNAPFFEGNKKGVDELCSNLIGNGTKNISKDDFNEEIDFLGASIGFSSHGAYASSLSKYAGRILELMADGALHPNFTANELDKEKAKLITGTEVLLKQNKKRKIDDEYESDSDDEDSSDEENNNNKKKKYAYTNDDEDDEEEDEEYYEEEDDDEEKLTKNFLNNKIGKEFIEQLHKGKSNGSGDIEDESLKYFANLSTTIPKVGHLVFQPR
jgi:hypothetical protein